MRVASESKSDGSANPLETQVRLLSSALGIRGVALEDAIPRDVIELATAGKRMQAIRQLRRSRGLRLLEAKRVVDELGRG
jgi:ribosomal protein L7/L12